MDGLTELTATELVEKIRTGVITSSQLVNACIERIEATDSAINAWQYFEPDKVREDAKSRDALRQGGGALGPLHGIPVALKDIFDTDDMPTELGSPIHAGRRPSANATVVDKLLEAGAIIMGKTVTTEFAFSHPAPTSNPHDVAHSPGGSSSGSAAAVAAGHIPLALGSQTNGSTIRPASYCGVFGSKPTRGMISRRGVFETSKNLDQVGIFGRSLEDVALLGDVLAGYDPADPMCFLRARPNTLAGAGEEPPVEPSLVWFELPFNNRLSQASLDGFEELLNALGGRVERFPAPQVYGDIVRHHKVIHEFEIARCLEREAENHWEQLSGSARTAVTNGLAHTEEAYTQALEMVEVMDDYYTEVFNDCDAIIAPSSTGEAPLLEAGSTGDPIFCTLWTFSGLPALSLPLLVGDTGLPIGVQLIGAAEGDDRLMRTVSWLLRELNR